MSVLLARGQEAPDRGDLRNDTTTIHFDNGWVKASTDPWNIRTAYDYNELGQQTNRTIESAGGSTSRTMGWSYYPDGKLKARSDDGIPVGKDVVLVDNSDTQNTASAGTWTKSNNTAGYKGHDYQYNGKGTGADTFTWKLTIPKTGSYEVWVSYQKYTDRATNAPYTIQHDGGTSTVPVNQKTTSGSQTEWKKLGTYSFSESVPYSVKLSDNADGLVVADAVKLVRDNTADTDSSEKKQFDYTYDVNGNLTGLTDTSSGAKVGTYQVAYDELNRVQDVKELKSGLTQHTTAYEYDANSNPTKRTHDQEIAEYQYDGRNLVDKVINKKNASDGIIHALRIREE